ncbi:MAG: diguanylate cyclase [Vicinamibacteria bacterium]
MPAAPAKSVVSTSRRFWALQCAIGVAWIVIWQMGRVLELTDHVSLWFPPAALTFASFLATGPAAFVAVTLAGLITTFQSAWAAGDATPAAELLRSGLAFGAVHCLAYASGARLFRRSIGAPRLDMPGAVVTFLIVSTLASFLAALGGLASLALTGSAINISTDLVPWWIGDLVGMVTLAPVFLMAIDAANRRLGLPSEGWKENLRSPPAGSSYARFVAKLGASVSVALVLGALGAARDVYLPVAFLVYALIVPLMWIAHTEGSFRTMITVACLSMAVVLITRFAGAGTETFNHQAAMIAIAGTGLFNLTVPALYADNQRLRDLVDFDSMTGALSRASFLVRGAEEIERATRYGGAVSLVVIDLDHFKLVNDTLGHAGGDRVLARFGALCRQELRKVDLFGRLGGEEFAALLPATDLAAAQRGAERLREVMASADWNAIAPALRVTASFGVAQIALPDEPLALAMERADRALYEAKGAGRDRVRVG